MRTWKINVSLLNDTEVCCVWIVFFKFRPHMAFSREIIKLPVGDKQYGERNNNNAAGV